jgi:hypothetical protein
MRIVTIASLTAGILSIASHFSASIAATWRCEEKASVGFSTDSDYQVLEYRKNKYIVSTEVNKEQFAEIFWNLNNWSENLKPAGLTVVGDSANYLMLCQHFEWNDEIVNSNSIICENHKYFRIFEFNLHTGIFSAASMSFGSSYSGSSAIRVGECVRID